jgi:ribosomal protein L34E
VEKHDLKGLTPESWACIDCGYNTAPGCLTRAELEKVFATQNSVNQTFNSESEIYTVHTHVWKAAGMEPYGGCLCIGCLEKRIGRQLRPEDFADHPFNDMHMPGTKRLLQRRTGDPFCGVTLREPPKGKIDQLFDNVDWRSISNGLASIKKPSARGAA